jgi:hypothetical protein
MRIAREHRGRVRLDDIRQLYVRAVAVQPRERRGRENNVTDEAQTDEQDTH